MDSSYSREDMIESAGDYLLQKHRVPLGREAHPGVSLWEDCAATLETIATEFSRMNGASSHIGQRSDGLLSGITTSHFESLLVSTGQIAARAMLNATIRDIRRMTAPVEVADYKSTNFPIVTADEIPALRTGSALTLLSVTGSGEPIQVEESTLVLSFSRVLLVNDDAGLVVAAFQFVGASTGRKAGSIFANLLVSNPTMTDGDTLFTSAAGNDLATAGLDVTAMDSMFDALRSVPTQDSGLTNAAPRFLLVPSSKEATAKVLVSSIYSGLPEEEKISVIASPWLPDTYAYLLPSPDEAPVIALAVLQGGKGDLVDITPLTSKQYREAGNVDGAGVLVRVALGMSAVSRSIVRTTLS